VPAGAQRPFYFIVDMLLCRQSHGKSLISLEKV
jgi:hypothetical protein